jgi:hypothetical protein
MQASAVHGTAMACQRLQLWVASTSLDRHLTAIARSCRQCASDLYPTTYPRSFTAPASSHACKINTASPPPISPQQFLTLIVQLPMRSPIHLNPMTQPLPPSHNHLRNFTEASFNCQNLHFHPTSPHASSQSPRSAPLGHLSPIPESIATPRPRSPPAPCPTPQQSASHHILSLSCENPT